MCTGRFFVYQGKRGCSIRTAVCPACLCILYARHGKRGRSSCVPRVFRKSPPAAHCRKPCAARGRCCCTNLFFWGVPAPPKAYNPHPPNSSKQRAQYRQKHFLYGKVAQRGKLYFRAAPPTGKRAGIPPDTRTARGTFHRHSNKKTFRSARQLLPRRRALRLHNFLFLSPVHHLPDAVVSFSKFSRVSSMTSGRFMIRVFMLITYSPKKPKNTSCTPPMKKTAIIIGA